MKNKKGSKETPANPEKQMPDREDDDNDPTRPKPGITDPERNDPTRIDDPEKIDPTRINDPDKEK